MEYILRHKRTKKYLTKPGADYSYTPDLKDAERFSSREAAERALCGNEEAVLLKDCR